MKSRAGTQTQDLRSELQGPPLGTTASLLRSLPTLPLPEAQYKCLRSFELLCPQS